MALAIAAVGTVGARAAGNVLVVSTPAGGLEAAPGYTLNSWIRVANNGEAPMHATVALAALQFGDEGTVRIEPGSDPMWAERVRIRYPDVTLPAHSYVDDPIAVAVPESLKPDTYFVGFLVTPEPGPGAIRVVNQIGTFVALNVPGPRHRAVRISRLTVPRFVIGRSVAVRLGVRNIGPSFATTWSELHVKAPARAELFHPFLKRRMLPAGLSRTYSWTAHVPFTFGPVRVRALAFFNASDQQVGASTKEATVFVIDPVFAAAIGGMLLAIALLFVRHRRRKPAAPAHRRPSEPVRPLEKTAERDRDLVVS